MASSFQLPADHTILYQSHRLDADVIVFTKFDEPSILYFLMTSEDKEIDIVGSVQFKVSDSAETKLKETLEMIDTAYLAAVSKDKDDFLEAGGKLC